MIKINNENKGISSFVIRIIAIISMIFSMYEETKKSQLSDCLLWFSFTLFAFLLVEGVNNTTNRELYLRRMLLFTLVAEVPYDLFTYGNYWDLKGQSCMLTLFIGFIICNICDYFRLKLNNSIVNIIAIVLLTYGGVILANLINCRFGTYGILLISLFYASYNLSYPRIFEFVLMVFFGFNVTTVNVIDISINNIQYSIPIVAFAILALFITWLYNEKRGPNTFKLKIAFYLIYPISLLTFYILKTQQII